MERISGRDRLRACTLFGLLAAALVVYSQTWAYTGDEGFHLLAAQSILRGMRPWIDFCFPQAPLIAYWNASWMALFGQSWRVSHAISAILTAAAAACVAHYVARRFPLSTPWRAAAAVAAGLLCGLNAQVFEFGLLGQAYGLCLLLLVAAFRMAILEKPWAPFTAGFFAGAAAAASLLCAPVIPVLFVWFAWHRRWRPCAVFAAGCILPWLPVAWLFLQGPYQAWFNLVTYHARYRRLYWPETTQHDLEVLASSIDSGQTIVLGGLAIFGLYWVIRHSDWHRTLKSEVALSAWLALTICLSLSFAHPTFPRYYLLAVPFLAVPAAAGLYQAGSRLFARPAWPLALVLLLTATGLAKSLYERRENYTWGDYEAIAHKIQSATPPHGTIFAGELLYFLMRYRPMPGLEFYYDRKIPLPAPDLARLHILPLSEVERRLSAGVFDTVYICEDEETYDRLGLPKLYRNREEIEDCMLFSNRK